MREDEIDESITAKRKNICDFLRKKQDKIHQEQLGWRENELSTEKTNRFEVGLRKRDYNMLLIPKLPTLQSYDKSLCMAGISFTLNDQFCPMRECRDSGIPFNRAWPGHQRPFSQSESAENALFPEDGLVTAEAGRNEDVTTPVVRSLSAGIVCRRHDRKVSFTLPQPGQYVFENGDFHHPLHLFFDPIYDYAGKENARWYFGPGIHYPDLRRIRRYGLH